MPFGLTNTSVIMQRYINSVLLLFFDKSCSAYLDNILIWLDKNHDDYIAVVKKYFTYLWKANLFINVEKCEFSVIRILFLGYILMLEGLNVKGTAEAITAAFMGGIYSHFMCVLISEAKNKRERVPLRGFNWGKNPKHDSQPPWSHDRPWKLPEAKIHDQSTLKRASALTLKMDPEKVKVILEWLIPRTLKDL